MTFTEYLFLLLALINIPFLLYLCYVNWHILKYEKKIHEVEIQMFEVSYKLLEATQQMEKKL